MNGKRLVAGGTAAIVLLAGAYWYLGNGQHSDTPPAVTQRQPAMPAKPGFIALDAGQQAALRVETVEATVAADVPLANLPASIDPPPNARVAVAAPLPGVVTRTFVVVGDSVRAGQALATVASRDVITLSADLARAQGQLGVAQANAGRIGQLAREGIVAGARADEARAMLRQAQVDVTEKARIMGMSHASGSAYTLTAPIAGRVSGMTVQTGQPLDGMMAPFVIDAADRYEVNAQVPERLIGQVHPGMKITIAPDMTGTVTSVGSTIDPGTRSAALKASIGVGPGVVAGRTTTVTLLGPAPAGTVVVPVSAVSRIDGRDSVFVRARGGFMVRAVTTSEAGAGRIVLLSGVKRGEQVAISAVSELKALASGK